MDERFLNVSDDNTTSTSWNLSSESTEESTVSANQIYVCNLYKFVVTGVIQLIISIIGFAGKSMSIECNVFEAQMNYSSAACLTGSDIKVCVRNLSYVKEVCHAFMQASSNRERM